MNQTRPWYWEAGEGNYFNEWSLVHFLAGLLSRRVIESDMNAFLAHAAYESIEGQIFPYQARDTSMENHVGDSISFMLGRWL